MNRIWTEIEKNFIRTNAHRMTDKELSDKLTHMRGRNVSIAAVRKQRHAFGLKKVPGRGRCELKDDLKNKTEGENTDG